MKIEESTIVETNDFKVIIYPASRALTAKEVKEITEKLYDFLPTWNAHGKGLTSSFKIDHKQFIIIKKYAICFVILIIKIINLPLLQSILQYLLLLLLHFC